MTTTLNNIAISPNKTSVATKNVVLLRSPCKVISEIKHPIHFSPPSILKSIEAIILFRTNHKVRMIDGWVENVSDDKIIKMLHDRPVDVVVLLVDSFSLQDNTRVARLIKSHSKAFVIAIDQGFYGNFAPHHFEEDFDLIVPGEYEGEIIQFINHYSPERREALVADFNRRRDVDQLVKLRPEEVPGSLWNKKELRKYTFNYPIPTNRKIVCGYVMASRGCPHECIFCTAVTRKSFGRRMRYFEPKEVVDEIEKLTRFGVNTIFFEDDDFTTNRKHVTELCRQLIDRGLDIHWIAHSRVENVDREFLKLMHQAGCRLLLYGVESGSHHIVKLLKKTKHPDRWHESTQSAFREAKRCGIATCALCMIGSPEETVEDVDQTIALVRKLQPDIVKVHYFTPYPGSEIFERHKDKLSDEDKMVMHHYSKPVVNLSKMSIETIIRKRREFYRKSFLNVRFLASHISRFSSYHLHNSQISLKVGWNVFKLLFK